jgi:Domain of unknown function (DUF4440)
MFALFLALALQGAPAASVDQMAFAAQDARFNAMISANASYLEGALDPSLTYQHSTGTYQSKAEFVEAIRTGALKYKAIEVIERRARPFGSVIIVTGIIRVQAVSAAAVIDTRARFTDVYERRNDRLVQVAWQNTRIP